ncbi:hypothetical protein PVAP13_9NG389446 [Panicum virgatum]|uniref:Uncharacterized protein n=1 Tax=Panicum virgatum TaxID=38727 RepID=A0A8T0MM64_PANVG|nr:hypothetical protein PVAP13_9NG389446 [Panicum virgatum]
MLSLATFSPPARHPNPAPPGPPSCAPQAYPAASSPAGASALRRASLCRASSLRRATSLRQASYLRRATSLRRRLVPSSASPPPARSSPPPPSSPLQVLACAASCYQRAKVATATSTPTEASTGYDRTCLLFSVDHRSRTNPPLPDKYLGSCVGPALALAPKDALAASGVGGLLSQWSRQGSTRR